MQKLTSIFALALVVVSATIPAQAQEQTAYPKDYAEYATELPFTVEVDGGLSTAGVGDDPIAAFTFPYNAQIETHKTSLGLNLNLNGNTDINLTNLEVYAVSGDQPDVYSGDWGTYVTPTVISFANHTETKEVAFSNLANYYRGHNYYTCIVYDPVNEMVYFCSGAESILDLEYVVTSLYRFWSGTYKGHFYTTSSAERDYLIATNPYWSYEGTAYFTSNISSGNCADPDASQVYRFWSDIFRKHFYTISAEEKDYVVNTYPSYIWRYEGVAFCAFAGQVPVSSPVHRFWSNSYLGHFYTISTAEKNALQAGDPNWGYEGVAFFGVE